MGKGPAQSIPERVKGRRAHTSALALSGAWGAWGAQMLWLPALGSFFLGLFSSCQTYLFLSAL